MSVGSEPDRRLLAQDSNEDEFSNKNFESSEAFGHKMSHLPSNARLANISTNEKNRGGTSELRQDQTGTFVFQADTENNMDASYGHE